MRGNRALAFQFRFDDLGQLLARLHAYLAQDQLKTVQESLKKDIANRRAMDERQSILQRVKSLNPREYEIPTHVITGMLNKQIAFELDISEKTLRVHRGRVMEKLGIDSLAQLVHLREKARIDLAQFPDP